MQREVAWAREAQALSPEYALLPILRGLKRPALKLLFGEAERVSIVLGDDDPIEAAVPAIVQALGLAPPNATPRPDPVPAPPMAELILKLPPHILKICLDLIPLEKRAELIYSREDDEREALLSVYGQEGSRLREMLDLERTTRTPDTTRDKTGGRTGR